MYRFIVVLAVFAGLLFSASAAQADIPGYPKAQRNAEKRAAAVAEKKYEGYHGASMFNAICKRVKKNWRCAWSAVIDEPTVEPVWGRVLLTKRSHKFLTTMRWGYIPSV